MNPLRKATSSMQRMFPLETTAYFGGKPLAFNGFCGAMGVFV